MEIRKITVRQLLEAEKSGRELTDVEAAALKQIRSAVKESIKIQGAVTRAVKETLNNMPKPGPFDFLLNGGFFSHICNKYPDYTFSELQSFLKGNVLESEYIEYSKELVKKLSGDLNPKITEGPTQKQKAIILYFLDKVGKQSVPRASKKEFLKQYNNSHSLYHEWLEVSQGKNIDENNLRKAIEYITDPQAKELANAYLSQI